MINFSHSLSFFFGLSHRAVQIFSSSPLPYGEE